LRLHVRFDVFLILSFSSTTAPRCTEVGLADETTLISPSVQVPSSSEPAAAPSGGVLLVIAGLGFVAPESADADDDGAPVCGVSSGPSGAGVAADVADGEPAAFGS
jgi:hypothetical protein